MSRYAFHDLTLEVAAAGSEPAADLDRILDELSWSRAGASSAPPHLSLAVVVGEAGFQIPVEAREVLRADGFRGMQHGDDFYLTDGETHLRLEARNGRGEVRLAPSFSLKPLLYRQNFWVFALLKMLRPSEMYALHAGGIVAEDGTGLLVVGASGSGKSTLTIGLVRRGWRYLSDDAVLLRSRSDGVEALALRKYLYVVDSEAADYVDFPLGEERSDSCGGRRRRVGVEAAFPSLRVEACVPRVVLFTRVSRELRSVLRPLERSKALGQLVCHSSSQLFDPLTMTSHLATLKRLLLQAETYELDAGLDLREEPALLPRLLAEAGEGKRCHASS